jgi:phospho-N-acetylmuramoyl-pentapeptide-transferase
MLYYLGAILEPYFGPFRLLKSHLFLIAFGLYAGFFITFFVLPRMFKYLPQDRGREFAAQGTVAKGKPTGAGIVFITIFVLLSFLVVPMDLKAALILVLAFLVCLTGFLDDKSATPWGEYLKGGLDLVLAAGAGYALSLGEPMTIWLPFTTDLITVPAWAYACIACVVIWLSINSTNCSDGVDGLSGTLSLISLLSLAFILYFALGHTKIAAYLLLPHYPEGAKWAVMSIALSGTLAAYLWYNAFPSKVLMGDAGSRAIGFIIGVMVMSTGNPFILFIIAGMLLVNGGTGLVKVALLRFLKIRIFHNTRFPLHDHVRENRQWSNAQVLVKFAIIQILITTGLFGLFVKVR